MQEMAFQTFENSKFPEGGMPPEPLDGCGHKSEISICSLSQSWEVCRFLLFNPLLPKNDPQLTSPNNTNG